MLMVKTPQLQSADTHSLLCSYHLFHTGSLLLVVLVIFSLYLMLLFHLLFFSVAIKTQKSFISAAAGIISLCCWIKLDFLVFFIAVFFICKNNNR